jgi:hypothetical protein
VVRPAIGSLAVRAAEGVETSRPRLVDRATAEKYDDQVAIVDYKEFPGRSDCTLGQPDRKRWPTTLWTGRRPM